MNEAPNPGGVPGGAGVRHGDDAPASQAIRPGLVGGGDVPPWRDHRQARSDQQEADWFKSTIGLLLLIPFGIAFLLVMIAMKIGEIYDWNKRRKNPKAQ